MSIPFEQDVEIEKFIRKFKNKHRVRGTITITMADSGFTVETDKNNLLEEETTQYEKGHANGHKEAKEEIKVVKNPVKIPRPRKNVITKTKKLITRILFYQNPL